MDPFDAAFLKGVISFALVAVTGLSAWRMWLRTRYLTATNLEPVVEALREENAQLRGELDSRLAELEGRVDFAERRLVQERASPRLPERPARTPV